MKAVRSSLLGSFVHGIMYYVGQNLSIIHIVAWLHLNNFLYVFLTYKNRGKEEAETDQEKVWHQSVHFCLICFLRNTRITEASFSGTD